MRIAGLTNEQIVKAFFGEAATYYEYTVTEDDFDDLDDGPPAGTYSGVEVPPDLAARWDAGLRACGDRGIKPASREGYAVRLGVMYPDGVPVESAAAVEAVIAAREAAAEEAARPQREYDAGMAQIAELTAGLTPTGFGPDLYRGSGDSGGWECHWNSYCHQSDPALSPRIERLGEPLLTVLDSYVDGAGRAVRAMVWQTDVGYIVEDPSIHKTTHYVSAAQATDYRRRWARLHGVDRAAAEARVNNPYIGEDQREMYRAVLAAR